LRASCSWAASLNRWKKDAEWMAESRPWRALSDVREWRSGAAEGEGSLSIGSRDRKAGSNASPARKATGKDSGVERNS
jgi:hypothetical protein